MSTCAVRDSATLLFLTRVYSLVGHHCVCTVGFCRCDVWLENDCQARYSKQHCGAILSVSFFIKPFAASLFWTHIDAGKCLLPSILLFKAFPIVLKSRVCAFTSIGVSTLTLSCHTQKMLCLISYQRYLFIFILIITETRSPACDGQSCINS